MKLTIVLGAFFPVPPTMGGAVEKIWFALARQFAARGHEVVLISRQMPTLLQKEIADGVKHIRVRGFDAPRSLPWLKVLDFIYSLNARSVLPEADIVVTNTFWLPILLRDQSRGRIYVHVGRYPKGQMRFYKRASRLQAPSKAITDAIKRQAPELSVKVATIPYPAPEPENPMPPTALSSRPKIILFVGRVHPEKGVHLLVDAFVSGLRTVFADWKLMIVGPADTKLGGGGEEYLELVKVAAKPAGKKAVFQGPVFDRASLEKIFREARIFVYPSVAERGESFGLAPLEAMTHGCAVLVSNLDCFNDFITDGQTGFIFDHRAGDSALYQKLANMIADPDTLARIADAGRSKSAEYSPDRVAEGFLADFESIVSEPYAERTNR
jgi:glycosyltransferase involved in cell wall biosynthesis